MGHATGKLSEGFEFLRLLELQLADDRIAAIQIIDVDSLFFEIVAAARFDLTLGHGNHQKAKTAALGLELSAEKRKRGVVN